VGILNGLIWIPELNSPDLGTCFNGNKDILFVRDLKDAAYRLLFGRVYRSPRGRPMGPDQRNILFEYNSAIKMVGFVRGFYNSSSAVAARPINRFLKVDGVR